MTTAKIKAIAPWFGGKRTLAPTIVEELGPHRSYFTLGCGSMADLFAKPPASHETAVDQHGHLINLARVIADDALAPQLYDRLQRTLCSEDLYLRSRDWYANHREITEPDMPDVEAAYHYFITSWVGRNGVSGTKRDTYQMAVRWTPGGGHGGVRFRSATESLPVWHQRLRSVMILCRDMFDVLPRIADVEGQAIYVDPPYLLGTRGADRYEHDFRDETGTMFEDEDDHALLAAALKRFQTARVVVSYYDHARLAKLYPGWTIRKVTRQKNLHVQNRRGIGRCEAPEVLILNGPSLTTNH